VEVASSSEDLCGAFIAVTPWFVPNLWHIQIRIFPLVWSGVLILDSSNFFKNYLQIIKKYIYLYIVYIYMHTYIHIKQEGFSSSEMRHCVFGCFPTFRRTQCRHLPETERSNKHFFVSSKIWEQLSETSSPSPLLSSAHTSSQHCSTHCLHQLYCWTSCNGNSHTATQRHVSNDAYAGEVGFQYSTVGYSTVQYSTVQYSTV
jgi:hypothetical protein